jgi:hypothetical protein
MHLEDKCSEEKKKERKKSKLTILIVIKLVITTNCIVIKPKQPNEKSFLLSSKLEDPLNSTA